MTTSTSEDRTPTKILSNSLRKRSKSLRIAAVFLIATVVLLSGAGIWIFFEAGSIAKDDVQQTSPRNLQETNTHISNLRKSIAENMPNKKTAISHDDLSLYLSNKIRKNMSLKELSIEEYKNENSVSTNFVGISSILRIDGEFAFISKRRVDYINGELDRLLNEHRSGKRVFATMDSTIAELSSALKYDHISNAHISSWRKKGYTDSDLDEAIKISRAELIGTFNDHKKISDGLMTEFRQKMNLDGSLNKLIREYAKFAAVRLAIQNDEIEKLAGVRHEGGGLSKIDPWLVLQTNITRFGPLLLILFFISILMSLFRYNMRLSAFYDSRADAIDMVSLDIDVKKLDGLVSAVSPESYDFGKPPTSPAGLAVDLAKSVIDKTKSAN